MLAKLPLPVCAVALLLGCRPPADIDTPDGRASATAETGETPDWLLLAWGTKLAPRPGAPAAMILKPDRGLAPAELGPGRAVRVIERDGDHYLVETVSHYDLRDVDAAPIEHLDYYALRLYVPVEVGTPLVAAPSDAGAERLDRAIAQNAGIIGLLGDPPLQSGAARPPDLASDWRVDAGAKVYWRDGTEAGEVTRLHAFVGPGEFIETEIGGLRCHAIVLGPAATPGGEVCFASEQIYVGEPMAGAFGVLTAGEFGDSDLDVWGDLTGDEIGEAYGVGGLGLGAGGYDGGGSGGGGAAEGIGGLGTVGTGGGGVSGGVASGYGVGSVQQPPLPKLETETLEVQGPPPAAVERVVNARRPTLARCVGEAHDRDPELAGEIELDVEVDGDGKVVDLEVQTADDALRDCVEDTVVRWRFHSGAPGSVRAVLSFEQAAP